MATTSGNATKAFWLCAIICLTLALIPCMFCGDCDCDDGGAPDDASFFLPKPPAGGPAIDHKALITDASAAVIEQGKSVYATSCQVCHGAKGEGLIPTARKFTSQPFVNNKYGEKSDPLSMFDSITNGFNNNLMPPQPHLSPEERYAVIHFIREEIVKKSNASQYVAIDDDYLANADFSGLAPAPVLEEGDPGPHPQTVPITIPVYAILDVESKEAERRISESNAVLASLPTKSVDAHLQVSMLEIKNMANTQFGNRVYQLIKDNKSVKELSDLLLSQEIASVSAVFGTLNQDDFDGLHKALKEHLAQ